MSKDLDNIISVEHLGLRYGDTEVFDGVHVDIKRGEFTSIVGPNGSGKTQLMRTMLGFVEPTMGHIHRNISLSDIGYVPQKVQIDPSFPITVKEFLQTYAHPKRIWGGDPLPALDDVIDVSNLYTRQLGKLSGGQLQRVMLAAILSTQPKALFLDEFSAGVDPRGQAELFDYLHTLNELDGITIVMISHDIDITTQYADTALCLNKKLICSGKPQDIFTANTFEQMYGIPLTKLTHSEHEHGDEHEHSHA